MEEGVEIAPGYGPGGDKMVGEAATPLVLEFKRLRDLLRRDQLRPDEEIA